MVQLEKTPATRQRGQMLPLTHSELLAGNLGSSPSKHPFFFCHNRHRARKLMEQDTKWNGDFFNCENNSTKIRWGNMFLLSHFVMVFVSVTFSSFHYLWRNKQKFVESKDEGRCKIKASSPWGQKNKPTAGIEPATSRLEGGCAIHCARQVIASKGFEPLSFSV